jgi:hypothetical protein
MLVRVFFAFFGAGITYLSAEGAVSLDELTAGGHQPHSGLANFRAVIVEADAAHLAFNVLFH